MFKNKMNAYGFMLVTVVWVVFLFLDFFPIPHVGEVAMYLFSLIAFLFFIIAMSENKGFAIVGLILALLPVLGSGAGLGFVGTISGIAYLFFAFAFIKSKSTTLNLLAWSLILVFLFTGLFALWNVY
ncbi:MAG: hypothetical protein KAH30_03255, partial [Caldisericia bacterium]|nr:hypothetical protein [Caldisericia bacterium]